MPEETITTPPGARLPGPGHAQHPPVDILDLQNLLSLILDGSVGDLACAEYHARLAAHVRAHDPATLDMASELIAAVRGSYRSAAEHAHHVARVSVRKSPDGRVCSMLDSDCAICLKPLRGPAKLVRVRAHNGDSLVCGHFFHAECFGEWELHDDHLVKKCPLCRTDLGGIVRFWDDQEAAVPRF